MVRNRVCVTLALSLILAAACGEKKNRSEGTGGPSPEAGPPAAAAGTDKLIAALANLPPVDVRRFPMRQTPQANTDPRASTYYNRARDGLAGSGDIDHEALLSYVDRWAAAPKEMRELAASKPARDAAEHIAVGAGAPTGATPVGEGQSVDPYLNAGAVAIVAALENAAANPEQSAWELLATIRLGQDLARGPGGVHSDAGASLIRGASTGIRQVVLAANRKKLDDKALTALLTGCRVVAASHPDYTSVLVADLTVTAEALAKGENVAYPVDKLVAEAELVAAINAPALKRAAEREEKLAVFRKDVWPEDAPATLDVDRFGRWLLAGGDTTGTCLALALELDRRGRKKQALAPKLDDLSPKPLEQPILDPLSGEPWSYVDDGFGGRLLRSALVVVGDKTETVEIRIPKR